MSCKHARVFHVSTGGKRSQRCGDCGATSMNQGQSWMGDAPTSFKPEQHIPAYGAASPEVLAAREATRKALAANQGEGDWVTNL